MTATHAPLRPTEDVGVLLQVRDLVCSYPIRGNRSFNAVDGVSFDVRLGETLGLVGESGCGKSTTGRAIIQLPRPTGGSVRLGADELTTLRGDALRTRRRQLQMVFQDPISSLNPRRTCGDIVAEPLRIAGGIAEPQIRARVERALETVGFDPAVVWDRRPHQFSGGQCQRISLARAIVGEPKFLICDEPVSSLDVSVQAQILNLLEDMKASYGLTMIFISHDLAVIKQVSDRVAVMYLGRLCELAPADALYGNPRHPYTAALLGCVPRVDRPTDYDDDALVLEGELPSPIDPPSGCRFRTRCPRARDECAQVVPEMRELAPGHRVACHFPLES
ncbi:MAG TPA: ATP-binding cassette domain-containing protein [Quisquiliibacterium sp.]|jgi:peptide/nickel transport system ATP-binding protein|nr:ATP-binding cassette domain-containing protein [Quisquiliibacterium sp.]HQD84937.1 ATP-binding cassette domain-containing protein [Quisquiliibacterium sp.]HQN11952.1 ATP-binding cassette domain-containing protein [Quisquiliibacterium sp.]HQP67953.1 ATP-binding cassette domain-containing protein [Quisquiliibacterium sp.]